MDKKLKIKHKKKENMYFVEYSKVKEKEKVRYELLRKLNEKEEVIFFVDTGLGKIDNKKASTYHDLSEEASRDKLLAYISDHGLGYQFHTRKREVTKTLFGISAGKKTMVEDFLGGIALGKAQMTEELFNLLCCTHDYYIGIHLLKPVDEIFHEFTMDPYWRIDKSECFKHTLVDSHFLMYFYTSYNFETFI